MNWAAEVEAAAADAEVKELNSAVQEVVPGRTLNLDGDYAAYFCAGGSETDAASARYITDKRIEMAWSLSGATHCQIHLTHAASNKGKRYHIASVKPYQGQRKGHKPKNWAFVREYLETARYKNWLRIHWEDREADDGLGLSSNVLNPITRTVIHTRDKDMQMLPGTHMSWTDYELTFVPYGAYEVIGAEGKTFGHKWFWLQMLQGDTADHIPGLETHEGKNVGPDTAATLLAGTCGNAEAYEVVGRAYEATYGQAWTDRFVEQAALLWIRRTTSAPIHEFLEVVPSSLPLLAACARLKRRVNKQERLIAKINQVGA
jgi:hypothetical protein